jgi:TolB protein
MQVLSATAPRQERDVFSVLETLDVDSGARTVLAEFDYLVEAPNWTRDGRSLVYNSKGLILEFDLATRTSRGIPTGFAVNCNNDHVLSPDGRQLAISYRTAEDGLSRAYTLPLAGGHPTLITPIGPSFLHGWSPDGGTLAYCGERNGDWDIYIIPAIGGHETRLTAKSGRNDGSEYSPDGRHIWFNSTRSGLMQVWRMNADGTDQSRMTTDQSNSWFPHVSPDGRRVAYIAYREGDVEPDAHPANKDVELRLMPAAGGAFRTIAEVFGGQGTINVNSWSPDNRTIAFVSYRLKG